MANIYEEDMEGGGGGLKRQICKVLMHNCKGVVWNSTDKPSKIDCCTLSLEQLGKKQEGGSDI